MFSGSELIDGFFHRLQPEFMADPIIDLQSDDYFMGEASRQAACLGEARNLCLQRRETTVHQR